MATLPAYHWYVVFCKPRQESQVGNFLCAKGLEVYCPTCLVRSSESRASRAKPFFPRYLFVRADLDTVGTSVLNWVPGAVGLVTYGETPARVPQSIIDELKKQLSAVDPNIIPSRSPFRCGERVRIVDGPFSGYEALFDSGLSGSLRVRLLMQMLDRQVKVTVSSNAIEPL